MNAYFAKIMKNEKNAVQCPEIAIRLGITHGSVARYFGKYINPPEPKKSKVKAVNKTSDGMIETYGHDDKLICNLAGEYSHNLYRRINRAADNKTKWNGFQKSKK